ncbi:unnamed protein product [Pleuronectes platessa]|uniref:Uncharacterized protein n=1 Tax=Pleuronectes platessa TaxID=8262 RepID=A0A9N7TZ14_PLEPL|nr:unnamed protein product [Pleuronectes platessa]
MYCLKGQRPLNGISVTVPLCLQWPSPLVSPFPQVLYIPVMTRLSRRTCTNQLRALSALAVLRVIASSSSLLQWN